MTNAAASRKGRVAPVAARNGNGNSLGGAAIVPWVAVILSLGAAFWSVANPRDDIKSLKTDTEYHINELRKEIQSHYLTIAEALEFRTRLDKDIVREELAIRTLQADLVSRSEHQQHWAEQSEKLATLRDTVVAVQKEFSGSWNIGKQLDLIQREIDSLQQAVTGYKVSVSPPPPPVPAK